METWRVGVNLSALEDGSAVPGVANQDFALPTDTEFDFLQKKGLNLVRLPFKWERMQPALSGALDAQYLGHLQAAVAKAGVRGIAVVLDCHNYGGYRDQKIGAGRVTLGQFADLWLRLANVFKTDPAIVAYDIMNEPSNMPAADAWQHAAQAAIDAVRAIDKKRAIFVEGNNYSSAFTWVRENPTLHLLRDPSNRLVFSAHAYLDRDNSGTHYAWQEEVAAGDQVAGLPLDIGIGVRRVAGFVSWLQAHQLAGNVGETGAGFDHPDWLRALDLEIAFLLKHRVSFIYWNLGPFFQTYPYSIEPDGKAADKVQVAVLTKYTKAAQPDTYTVMAERKGLTAPSSYAITISYRGLVAAPITFLLDDGDSGGTFSPAKVTLPQGFNGKETVAYVLADSATATIRLRNTAGLRDPAALKLDP